MTASPGRSGRTWGRAERRPNRTTSNPGRWFPGEAAVHSRGDYTGLTINFDIQAHPVWSDTRNRDPFAPNNGVTVDEDYFTVSRNLPSGTARTSRVTRLR
jgi:hypothetical protein